MGKGWKINVTQVHSHAIIDLHSVKSVAMVSQSVGFDAGKKITGRKRFITVDTLGLVLRVLVTPANMGEREGGKQALQRLKQSQQVSRLTTIAIAKAIKTYTRSNPFFGIEIALTYAQAL